MDAVALTLAKARLFCESIDFGEGLTDCWIWQRSLSHGYGQFNIGRRDDGRVQIRRAHRVAYEMWVGPIPDGLTLDHLCYDRRCVNPLHLDPVTQGVNNARGPGNGNRMKTHCKYGHELAGENLIIVNWNSRTFRRCRACKNREGLRRYHRIIRREVWDGLG